MEAGGILLLCIIECIARRHSSQTARDGKSDKSGKASKRIRKSCCDQQFHFILRKFSHLCCVQILKDVCKNYGCLVNPMPQRHPQFPQFGFMKRGIPYSLPHTHTRTHTHRMIENFTISLSGLILGDHGYGIRFTVLNQPKESSTVIPRCSS